MTDTGIDAVDVLRSYAEVLIGRSTIVRDARVLPHPKPIIRAVLEHCLELNEDEQTAKTLGLAYVALSDFQPLTQDQRQAVDAIESSWDPSTLSARELQQIAVRMAKLGSVYDELLSKILTEREALRGKLDELAS